MSKILSSTNSTALSLSTTNRLDLEESQSLPSPLNASSKEKGKRVPTAIISITETDLLSLEPKDFNPFNNHDLNNDLDLFSSYADSVASPLPQSDYFGLPSERTNQPSRAQIDQSRSLSRPISSSRLLSSSKTSPLHSTLLPSEDSVEILKKRPLTGKLSSVTIKRNAIRSNQCSMRRGSSFGDETALLSSPSVSVFQMNFEQHDNSLSPTSPKGTTRLPIFRPLPGKRLSSNPYTDARDVPSTRFYRYSLNASQELPPLASNSSSMTSMVERATDFQPSESLQNLTLGSEVTEPDSETREPNSPSPEKPVLGGHLEASTMIREPPAFSPSKYRRKKGKSVDNLADRRLQTTNSRHRQVSLYRPSTGSLQNPSLLDPLPYQVHGRVLGWKLTSVQRRKELIDVVDMMKEKARLAGSSKSTVQRRLLTTDFTGKDFINEMHPSSNPSASFFDEFFPSSDQNKVKLSVREVEAWQHYVTRSLKSRQGYKSVKQIRNLMEEKRKTEKLTEIASHRHDLLRNRGGNRRQNILNERSTDSALFEQHSKDILSRFEFQTRNSLSSSSQRVSRTTSQQRSRYLDPPNRDPQLHVPKNTSAVEFVYNFPKSIHKPRDRMDILESVAIRSKLEGQMTRERERQKEAMVDQFLSRGGALDTFSDERSPQRTTSKDGFDALDHELQLLGLGGDGGFDEEEGSGFAYLEELNLLDPHQAEEDYDPGTVDSILEKFGGGKASRGFDSSNLLRDADDLSELSLNQLEDIRHEIILPPQEIQQEDLGFPQNNERNVVAD